MPPLRLVKADHIRCGGMVIPTCCPHAAAVVPSPWCRIGDLDLDDPDQEQDHDNDDDHADDPDATIS
jgi:hypothetical protein